MKKTTIDTTTITSTTITVGLCAGRHPLPVEGYIFPQEVKNPLDFDSHKKVVEKWVRVNLKVKMIDLDNGGYMYETNKGVDLYVTGLTPCLTSAMQVFLKYNVPLTLWHFDRNTGTYVPQTIL